MIRKVIKKKHDSDCPCEFILYATHVLTLTLELKTLIRPKLVFLMLKVEVYKLHVIERKTHKQFKFRVSSNHQEKIFAGIVTQKFPNPFIKLWVSLNF